MANVSNIRHTLTLVSIIAATKHSVRYRMFPTFENAFVRSICLALPMNPQVHLCDQSFNLSIFRLP